jgi:hypothetical protein
VLVPVIGVVAGVIGLWLCERLLRRHEPEKAGPSLGRAVTEVDGAAAELVLLRQGQVQADLVGQGPGAASYHGRDDEQLVLVHQADRDGLGGEVRSADGEVTVGRFLQLVDLDRVEVVLDAGPCLAM